MPTITSVKPQRNGKRVNIYLDDKYGFGLDLETFVKLGLKVEQELSEEKIEKIVREGEFQQIYDKILRFGSLRPRSENEYIYWLRKHKVHKSLHEELFNRLKRLDFLNDKKFAAWWVDQRQTFRPKSKRILNYELISKGIKKEIINEVLDEANIDEVAQAKKLIEKKKYIWEKLDDSTARKKMSEYLARHGFGWETIKTAIKRIDEFNDSV
ncbi:hypothetical protein A2715_00490 [Candidatus Woesebacteria bacterium RIFCSPHIGHO2_01_FULL_39_32]|uniref:Regulatory protein RecX n=1 Tax=Candidatus Woesebacteria bacterium RIFCSPLOWO2_01_FULL_39_25 TaxID=1802521 RepID=A0A1F8BMV3_9BACT|nr:MAG: hypothetical protein A2124_04780 [Candidatus Woesebacteria bacterium GWB1_37_5]OGM24302.1 MAG: hypothetical protein A2715_00490 [Candidatus Woesebacteria bacterium RIFCSPHIGHO2_01_FULL_39_32]OGM35428.1 MAG: hypothetical protein A3F01_04845 [Candidatus Woesebacteria bacterium RIFCSPHIGHO2_12_FULL_38_11]OGM65373.1 MAG: hypothetical protein A2893_01445 [Candidatus Woesebacteria bacterium RIFCSPLOWO2_01_FULL_39_25]